MLSNPQSVENKLLMARKLPDTFRWPQQTVGLPVSVEVLALSTRSAALRKIKKGCSKMATLIECARKRTLEQRRGIRG